MDRIKEIKEIKERLKQRMKSDGEREPVLFPTYEEFAKALVSEDETSRQRAEILLMLRHHFVCWSHLDTERKGWFTADDLAACQMAETEGIYDYLSRPAAALYRVFGHIRANLRTRILRENKLLPLYKANEFNSRSIAWLSRRPGRTIRQKLAGTKSIMAVERRLTVDTTENRLFKALAKRFLALLLLKEEAVGEGRLPAVESELIGMMTSFLHSEECEEIGAWTITPPNNTLLSDRYYHVVWTVWMSLKAMHGQLAADQECIGSRLQTAAWMHLLGALGKSFRLPQQPIAYHLDQLDQPDDGTARLFSLRRPHFAARRQRQSLFFVENEARQTIGLASEAQRRKQLMLSFSKGGTSVAVQMGGDAGGTRRMMDMTASFGQQLDDLLQKFLPEAVADKAEEEKEHLRVAEGRQAVFDLYRPNPYVTLDGVRSALRQRLLQQQIPASGQEQQEVQVCSLSSSRAAFLDEDWPIASAADLIETADDRPENVLLLQQMFAEVREQVRADELVLICPDHCNDFELKPARQMAKLQYFHVRTMPRSLDGVFRLMKRPEGQAIAAGDVLVFVDAVPAREPQAGISVTVIETRYDSELEKKVPASRGLIFEHHPSRVMPMPLYEFADACAADACSEEYPERGQELLCQLGTEFLLDMADGLQLYNEDDTLVDLEAIRVELRRRHDVTRAVREALQKSKLAWEGKGLHIVSLAENLHVSPTDLSQKGEAIFLSSKKEGEGIAVFDAWTKQAGIAIWRDFLPNIAIKRLIGQFDLVKDSTFEYGFLKEKDITVPGARFILPKGQAEYHFQLEMSNVSEHKTYEAVVRHRAFPLAADTPCLLRMKYTYDDDIPYSLDFIPIDRQKSGFTIAHVTWQRLKEFPAHGLRYMDFPPPTTWHALEHHIGHKYKTEENILDLLADILQQATHEPFAYELLGLVKLQYCRRPSFYLEASDPHGKRMLFQVFRDKLKERQKQQLFDDLDQYGLQGMERIYLGRKPKREAPWRQVIDLSGYEWDGVSRNIIKWHCDADGSTVKVLKHNFIFQDRIPEHPGRISCSINSTQGFANDILDAEEPFFQLEDLCMDREKARRDNLINVLKYKSNGLRFDLHLIYGGGLSLSGDACPNKYQRILPMFAKMFQIYRSIVENAETENDNPIAYRVMNLFCMLHKDAGHAFYGMLDDWVMLRLDATGRIPLWVGYAFGDCTTAEQQRLLRHLAQQGSLDFVGLLARAAWRYPDFLYHAPKAILLQYLSVAISIIMESASDPDCHPNGLKASAYEYVLAMFRLRRLDDTEVDEVLSLNNPEMQKLYRCLEDQIRNHALSDFHTRLRLTVTRSAEYDRYADVPDFIYALLVCLTGTQDDRSIVITSIEDQDDD